MLLRYSLATFYAPQQRNTSLEEKKRLAGGRLVHFAHILSLLFLTRMD